MRQLLIMAGRGIAYLFPESFYYVLSKIVLYLCTGYKSRGIGCIGKRVLFYRGVKIKGVQHIYLGNAVSVGNNTVLGAINRIEGIKPSLIIGDNVSIGSECLISAANKIIIGAGTLLGSKITIVDNSHGLLEEEQLSVSPSKRKLSSKGPVIIGKNVWLGDKVTILPGVTIGDSVVIGSNSVVVSNIPSNCVAVGVPCKVVKKIIGVR